jgi:hypothetical protein
VGRSTDSLALAGVGKDGKKGSANLGQRRDPEKDRAAVQAYAAWVKATISRDIAPGLPSIAAASELRAKRSTAASTELGEAMRKLLGR